MTAPRSLEERSHAELVEMVRRMRKGLEAASGYLLSAKIDIETGAPKRTAIATIEGGLKTVRAILAEPEAE